jgi:hypothetical protein
MESTGLLLCFYLEPAGHWRNCIGAIREKEWRNVVNILSRGEPNLIEGRLMIVTQRWEVMAWSLLF